MSGQVEYAPGSFSWADLAARAPGVARDFYRALFGWTLEEIPMTEEQTYTIFSKDGKQVCAMFEMFSGMLEGGHPSYWQSYVSVESADAAVKRAADAGARVMKDPCGVKDAGRMAMIQDPAEAFLCIWQPGTHRGAQMTGRPGALCWNELLAKNAERAASFYGALFGWTTSVEPNPAGGDYVIFHNGDQPCAGMLEMRPEMGDMPPHWGVYFAVEGCDAALEEARRLGGRGTFPPMDVPGVGRIGGVMDPQGASFTVMEQWSAPA